MMMQGNKKKVGFWCEPDQWEKFKIIAKLNESDANKTLRIMIDDYISKNSQLSFKVQELRKEKGIK